MAVPPNSRPLESAADRRLDESEGLRWQGQDDGAVLGVLCSVFQVNGLHVRQDDRVAWAARGDGLDLDGPRERVIAEHDLGGIAVGRVAVDQGQREPVPLSTCLL